MSGFTTRGKTAWQYITKCLNGGDAYETSKFAEGLSHLTLSDGLRRMLRARPVLGERRLAQRDTPPAGCFPIRETLSAAGQWPVVTSKRFLGGGRSGAQRRPPVPQVA